ncbi:unnamed protein product [Dracunculus medinensis]|uniref:Rab-GAP TBC domain-containing protein n=1 Tax=Dracunculus medinensis TaxID=318479 RepID=A0A3P7PXC9_DRAME|nr:unnamed protein product [Dracunculus medinensis]
MQIEQRTIGGTTKRRYWFAVAEDSPYLYWYKNKGDVKCLGRLCLSGAAFTFDPRETGRFEIHVGDEEHILETNDNKSRIQWLQQLQKNRRHHFDKNDSCALNIEIVSLSSHSLTDENSQENAPGSPNIESAEDVAHNSPDNQSLGNESVETQSQFYLDCEGELNDKSLEMPLSDGSGIDLLRSIEAFLEKIVDETHTKGKNLEEPAKRVFGKAKASLGSLTHSSSGKQSCAQCKALIEIINNLKERCYELTDELIANRELGSVLRQNVLRANRQIDTLKRLTELKDSSDRIDFILERECLLTAAQMNSVMYSRQVETLKQQNRKLDEQNEALRIEIEAFRESVRSKEALIVKMCEEGTKLVPEGILIDSAGMKCDESMKRIFDEASVCDINEMRDLVEGYRKQNMFLNQEVLDLQKVIKLLEEREKRAVRRNFDIEACYYQMKSRYITVLNHFKTENANNHVLEPGVIEALIDETDFATNNRVPGRSTNEIRLTDSLGFYLTDAKKRPLLQSGDVLDLAAELKSMSDQIIGRRDMERSPQYIDWLLKWDSFLVNNVSRPLKPSSELKSLIRNGVPKTYRKRVWKRLIFFALLVMHLVGDQKSDLGNGYFELLLRKARRMEEREEYDGAMKQIELDLSRTLPTNKYFDEPTSEKIGVLRKVLFAYRFHNKTVGYCQGLNRLAAIALLFLDDCDAFWFLVACVEYLQPPDYYTPSLSCAVADQKVLRDLVGEKLPRLSSHLKKLEVDLSAFTLSWFLTCFVDVLPQTIYLPIFDVFLYEGNKVLFRFALAILKLAESVILECKTIGAVHASLSNIAQYVDDFRSLAEVAFNGLSSFPMKGIEAKRQFYISQVKF